VTTADAPGPVACAAAVEILEASVLIADGWEQRTITDPNRIGELEELYTSLGFETIVKGLDPDSFDETCNSCAISACSTYLALFTRKPAAQRVETTRPG
jgi:hypothetical protein